jgi:hypothetical protein
VRFKLLEPPGTTYYVQIGGYIHVEPWYLPATVWPAGADSPLPYQYLAEKAAELRRLGMAACAISRALKVTDRTITKALRVAAKIKRDPL